MFTYAAHLPSSPLSLPQISRERARNFKKIRDALADIAADLYARRVDTVVAITPLEQGIPGAFVLNFAPRFRISFHELGDFETRAECAGDARLAFEIRAQLCTAYPVQTVTHETLDCASGAAFLQLAPHQNAFRLLPLSYQLSPAPLLLAFGKRLRDTLEAAPGRIAVISLGDLSRTSDRNRAEGRKLDTTLIGNLKSADSTALAEHPAEEIDSFSVFGFRPLALLLGVLDGMNYATDILTYEQKFGVGMMVCRFNF